MKKPTKKELATHKKVQTYFDKLADKFRDERIAARRKANTPWDLPEKTSNADL